MITDQMEHAVFESKLSGDFVIVLGENGVRYAAFAGILMDYPTFCTMLLWAMSGGRMYSKLMESRPNWLPTLAALNPSIKKLSDTSENAACHWLFKKTCESLVGRERKSIVERFKAQIEDLPTLG